VSVTKDYLEEASSPNFSQSVKHGLENIQLLGQYLLHKLNIKKPLFLQRNKFFWNMLRSPFCYNQ